MIIPVPKIKKSINFNPFKGIIKMDKHMQFIP